MSVTIRELPDGRSKISVRSHPEVDSCAICAVYGGGGHKMASGCTLACDTETAVEKNPCSHRSGVAGMNGILTGR